MKISSKPAVVEILSAIEDRFKIVSGLSGNLSKYPIKKEDHLEFITDKDKAREYAEVFTPVYMVDEMLGTVPGFSSGTANLDLCSGYGQFSVRMLRKFFKESGTSFRNSFDVFGYLRGRHFFNELQLSSCYKLLWVFSKDINLFIGDALKLGKLPVGAKGIWYYLSALDNWIDITGSVRALNVGCPTSSGYPVGKIVSYSVKSEKSFVSSIENIVAILNKICKEPCMSIEKIVCTKEGRQALLRIIDEASTGVEKNWQENATPEWIVREMVNCIPGGVNGLKRILVLFNVEFLECLVKEKKVSPSKIDFGYDSEIEGLYAQAIYKVHTFAVGKSMVELQEATKDKGGRYDVIFSNPPYQIEDGGFGKSARPIYHEIVMHAIDKLQPQYACFITPSRWMAGGKGLNKYRARMLKDKRIRMIQDYPNTFDVFEDIGGIAGGVSYFLWDRDHNSLCEFNGIQRDIGEFDVLVRNNTSCQILRKVLTKHTGSFCDSRVLSRKPFGLATNFSDWVPEGTPGAVKCYCPKKDGFEKWVLPQNIEDTHGVLAKWKIFTPPAGWGGNAFVGGETPVISQIFTGDKISVCLETYLVAGAFSTKKEAENYADYMRTKFYRYMLSLRVSDQHITKDRFAWVPDFGDYSHPYTDQDLYSHFGLTKKEIEHIESTIKEIK